MSTLALLILTVTLGACASNPPIPTVSTQDVQPTPTLTAGESTSSISDPPPAPLPATLPNEWVYEPSYNETVQQVVQNYNKVFPNADFVGGGYRHPDENHGAIVLLIGNEQVDPSAFLYLVGANSSLHQRGLYTFCAKPTEKGGPTGAACITKTAPSVGVYFVPEEGVNSEGVDEVKLKDLAETIQTTL